MKQFDKIFISAAQLIVEDKEEEKKKSSLSLGEQKIDKGGSTGSGKWQAGITNAKGQAINTSETLAVKNARRLMKNLQVSSGKGKDDISSAMSVITQAVSQGLLSEAFESPVLKSFEDKDGKKIKAVSIPLKDPDEVSLRDGVAFIHLILVGAVNANLLELEGRIKFTKFGLTESPTFYAE